MEQLLTEILEDHLSFLEAGQELLNNNEDKEEGIVSEMIVIFKGALLFSDMIKKTQKKLSKEQLEILIKLCTIMIKLDKKNSHKINEIKGLFLEELNNKQNKQNKKPIIVEKHDNEIRITFEKNFRYLELSTVLEEIGQEMTRKSWRIGRNDEENSIMLEDLDNNTIHICVKNSDFNLEQHQAYLLGFLQFINK